jgi:hypothetical protein
MPRLPFCLPVRQQHRFFALCDKMNLFLNGLFFFLFFRSAHERQVHLRLHGGPLRPGRGAKGQRLLLRQQQRQEEIRKKLQPSRAKEPDRGAAEREQKVSKMDSEEERFGEERFPLDLGSGKKLPS